MASSRTTSRTRPMPQANVNIDDLRTSFLNTRNNFTRTKAGFQRTGSSSGPRPDFITFVSLACEIYRAPDHNFVPIAHYSSLVETVQGKGHTSLVTQASVNLKGPSSAALGSIDTYQDHVIIKRPRHNILEDHSDHLISFITELRVRSHSPLSSHPNIARLRGVGWDFEDEDATIPRPILLEELAPQGALDNFWKNWSFVKLNFKEKLQFCRNIAEGLVALHACSVVHGDIKPENILVFPRRDARNSFLLKLTDFGHSVIEADSCTALPAFTPQWSAPETTDPTAKSFIELMATDSYSFGLVLLSIMIGRPFYTALDGSRNDIEKLKKDGRIFEKLVEMAEKEDRDIQELDIDVDTIVLLLRNSVQLDFRARRLNACLSIIEDYCHENKIQFGLTPVLSQVRASVPALDVASKV
ncbi:kinase-like domain-containing protein [Plectosphaerella plurivora]|uniref:Kinase-like domain-containing protein n=1 Tax=Plectosphaerella plurivora TaxID=936078 RepID=A0A9P8V219_9PEZI|nr:kinase-like domain-containing protein [Plectosphaerella plurivora]